MKAAIYSPYLDTLGGGERYVISFAVALRDIGWDVYVESKDGKILEKIEKRLGIKTRGLRISPDVKRGEGFDLCFWLSDGSVPTLSARKNILHFQRPFYDTDGKSLINRMKFFRINEVVVNSKFTKQWIDKEYPQKSKVLYPPIDIDSFRSSRKENTILSVGRFSHLEQSKGQDVLVDVFKKMYDKKNSDLRNDKWKLILAGGTDVGRTKFVDNLKKDSENYPITVLESPPFSKIKQLYAKAIIFWTASGFGIDETKKPEKVEHFGITVVEAMSAGAVPMAFNAGGHKEIIRSGYNGYLWKTKSELSKQTETLIMDSKMLLELNKKATKDAQEYSIEKFEKNITKLL